MFIWLTLRVYYNLSGWQLPSKQQVIGSNPIRFTKVRLIAPFPFIALSHAIYSAKNGYDHPVPGCKIG